MLPLTISAVIGVPSWKTTSSRSVTVQVRPSDDNSAEVARCGTISPSGVRSKSVSYMWLTTVADGESVTSCGSSDTASVPWAMVIVCAKDHVRVKAMTSASAVRIER
jgi:hypothetical protein